MQALLVLCLVAFISWADCKCPDGWVLKRTSCYFISKTKVSWTAAKSDCASKGGYLANIDDDDENLFLRGIAAKSGDTCPFVGASDEANEGVWVSVKTGQKITYQGEWGTKEPNNGRKENCLCLLKQWGYKWNDIPCTEEQKSLYICEKAVCRDGWTWDGTKCYLQCPKGYTVVGNSCSLKCPDGWVKKGTSCYFTSTTKASWTAAKSDCASKGGYLVNIDDKAENLFLRGLAAKSGSDCPHVGASDEAKEGVWVSVKTGQKITYQGEWGTKEPNNGRKENCLCLLKQWSYKWNDIPCDYKSMYICEKDFA